MAEAVEAGPAAGGATPATLAAGNPLLALERIYRDFREPGSATRRGGRVTEVSATHFRVCGLSESARLGDVVVFRSERGARSGEVVRIGVEDVLVAPYERCGDIVLGQPVYVDRGVTVVPDESWRGRAVDALGVPIDARGPLTRGAPGAVPPATPSPLARQRVETAFHTGVRVIDIFTPLCYGQRIGIFAGSGVGKSTLLAMLASAEAFDTVVVSLVGERGREVREFLEDTLGEAGMRKTVAVVATSDESAMMRRRAADTAMGVAEHFRDRGQSVLLVLDSVTRFAHALREVAIGTGEPPVSRGYPPSVFTELPKLLERAGPGVEGAGSITAIISVLIDGDDHNDPIADAVRGILDGHIVLDRAIAEQGRFPAVNPLASVSRLANRAWNADQKALVMKLRAMIARYEDTRDIRLLGAYQPGADLDLDMAVRQVPALYEAMTQAPADGPSRDPFVDLARHLKSREKPNAAPAT